MGGQPRSHHGVHRFLIVNTSGLVIVFALSDQLQQMQRPLLTLIGLNILEYRGGLPVLCDDDRAVSLRCPGDQFGGASLEGRHGLDVLLKVHARQDSTKCGAIAGTELRV